jgi:DNA-binding transcriptional LysR family regulator
MSTFLDDMALFVEVGKVKNFSRAAETLGMPPSTLSRRVANLERHVGVRLLNRSTRRVELSEAGEVYFERCQHIINEARIAHEALTDVAQQAKGRLRISMPTSFAMMVMPEYLQEFAEQYPDIHCELDLGIQNVDLVTDPYDLVIRFGEQPDSGVVSRKIGEISLQLYASREYLHRRGQPDVPRDLSMHDCLRTGSSKQESMWTMHKGDATEQVSVSGRFSVNNVGMLRRMAFLGAGIVPLTSGNVGGSDDNTALVNVLPGWRFTPIPLLALYPSRLMPAKTRVFIDFLKDKLSQRVL